MVFSAKFGAQSRSLRVVAAYRQFLQHFLKNEKFVRHRCPLWSVSGQKPAELFCPLSAMYGRRLRCKGKIGHFSEAFGCSHVFGL